MAGIGLFLCCIPAEEACNEVKGLMKKNIHPNYVDCEISCLCGNVIKTRSTRPKLNVEICSNCHPFFTGQQKIVDTAGRVERFRKRYEGVQYGDKK